MIKSAHCTTTMDTKKAVASVLKNLAVSIGPLLSIGILEIVNSSAVPSSAETEQFAWPETVLAENDKVHEKSSRCLDHTNLTVGHGDQTFVYKFVSEWISGLPLHDVGLSLLVSIEMAGTMSVPKSIQRI